MKESTKQEVARNLRYKKAIVEQFNLEAILSELEQIMCDCDDVRYFFDSTDETLLNALDGDEDEEFEFRMMFSELSSESEQLIDILRDDYVTEYFDEFLCTVSKGSGMRLIGFDDYETDYFRLASYEAVWGQEESAKRLMRLTKQEIIRTGCQCFGIITSFVNIRAKYDNLKGAFDILRDANTSFLKTIKDIEAAYERADESDWSIEESRKFDQLVNALPDRYWIE